MRTNMNLKHIKEEVCPTCGSEAISESLGFKLIEGTREETRKFECGMVLRFYPHSLNVGIPTYAHCSNNLKEAT